MRRGIIVGALCMATGFMTGHALTAVATDETGPTKYLKMDGPDTMPYRIVLRPNCRGAEDTLARLILVDYTPERVVYRCRYPWNY